MSLTNLQISILPKIHITKKQLSQWFPITLILILATALRLYQLDTEGLWIDETFSFRDAENFKLTDLIGIRPVYYALLRVWMLFGTTDAWLRGLAVLFGIGSVFLIYYLGHRLAGRAVGLISALLMTFSPLFINHSQEIRFYTLSTCLCLVGTLILSYLLESPSKILLGWWAITRILATLTAPLNVLMLIPDTILYCWRFRKERRWLFLLGKGFSLIGCFLIIPAAYLFVGKDFSKFMTQHHEWPKPSIFWIITTLSSFTADHHNIPSRTNSLLQYIPNSSQGLWQNLISEATVNLFYNRIYSLVLVCLLGIALIISLRKRSFAPKIVWTAVWGILPVGVILLISYLFSSIWRDRYLLFIAPYFLILLAAGFILVWRWQKTLAIVVAIMYTFAVSGGLINYYTQLHRPDWQGVASIINNNGKTGDLIVIHEPNNISKYSLNRYYHGKIPVYNINLPQNSQIVVDRSTLEKQISNIPVNQSRLWQICWHSFCNQERFDWISERLVGKKFKSETKRSYLYSDNSIHVVLVTPTDSYNSDNNPES
ncbi:glycosyltransferase family 39 protein [Calothrix rhizosoleniae]|uniref:glycosyltransferase family 39 protein n=1 Tax=Calothrix rhizosoleniae TaxID=888997 RepID=UPI000B49F6AF|nr:glycosyltransferase family 39 protein [Calothrix rhizosoleniae]